MKKSKIFLIIPIIIFCITILSIQCSAPSPATTTQAPGTTEAATTTAVTTVETTASTTAATTAATTAETTSVTTAPIETTSTQGPNQITYTNTQYGFNFFLPLSWEGYKIIISSWDGTPLDSQDDNTLWQGPIISIRHPLWTEANPRQDIPIMVLTITQWDALKNEKFHIGAAPIDPIELGRNAKYVFALPARYNYAFPTGFEEVDKILQGNPLQAF